MDAELWVPEHFYVEVLGVIRHQVVIAKAIGAPTLPAAVTILRLPFR